MGVFTEYLMTEEEVEVSIIYWLKKLNLNFWEVAFRICPKDDLAKKGCSGNCSISLSLATALISLIDPRDFPKGEFKYDMEVVLVHELLHLHFFPFDTTEPGSLADDMQERAIDHIARSLVDLRREGAEKNEQAIHTTS